MPAFSEISPLHLMRLVGTPDAPVVLDVTIDPDFKADPHLIPAARRCPHDQVGTLVADLRGHHVVVVCQKGLKLSHGAAARLRAEGIRAEALAGGNHGWAAAGLPRVPARAVPEKTDGATLWVTRHRPKIDRIACPWLIRRFIDPQARFLFVPPAQVADVADRFDATPFDVDGVFWTHREDRCSFDTMVAEFGLSTPALERLARVVRAADTNRHDLAPEAAGLLAFSVGLSRQYKDDMAQLEAALPLYDALYRWARDGAEETHTHSQPPGPERKA